MTGQILDPDTLIHVLHHVKDRLIYRVGAMDVFYALESAYIKERSQQGIQAEIGIFDVIFGNTHFKGGEYLIELVETVIDPGMGSAADRDHLTEVISKIHALLPGEMDPVYGPGSVL
jgi:hypothetical protein